MAIKNQKRASRGTPDPAVPFTDRVVDQHIADTLGPLLAELQAARDPHDRGPEFELLLQKLFRLSGFDAMRDPSIAHPRQTDLLARRGPQTFLIEAKWQRGPIDIDDLDAMQARLGRAPRGTIGCFFSMSTYSKEAIARADELRKHELGGHELLLFFPTEVSALLRGGITLATAIDTKVRVLREEGKTLVMKEQASPRLQPLNIPFPTPLTRRLHDEELPLNGEAYNFAFGRLPDTFDTSRESHFGYELAGTLDVDGVEEMLGLLHVFHQHLRLSGRSSYTITEIANKKVWFGTQPEQLLRSLQNIRRRFSKAGIKDAHHSEEFSFYDVTQQGALFIFGRHNISTGRLDEVSFELRVPGVPLDLTPLHMLSKALHMPFDYLLPIDGRFVTKIDVPKGTLVDPIEYLVDTTHTDFINAAVVRNPFWQNDDADELPEPIRSLAFLVGRVRDHLGNDERVHQFMIRSLRVVTFREAWVVDLHLRHDAGLRYNAPVAGAVAKLPPKKRKTAKRRRT